MQQSFTWTGRSVGASWSQVTAALTQHVNKVFPTMPSSKSADQNKRTWVCGASLILVEHFPNLELTNESTLCRNKRPITGGRDQRVQSKKA